VNKFQTVIAVAAMALLPATVSAQAISDASSVSLEQRKAFEGVIKDYLLKNPVIIRQAIQALQAQEEANKQAQASAALKTPQNRNEAGPQCPGRLQGICHPGAAICCGRPCGFGGPETG